MGNNSNIWQTSASSSAAAAGGGGGGGGGGIGGGASMRNDTSRLGIGTSFVYLIEVREKERGREEAEERRREGGREREGVHWRL